MLQVDINTLFDPGIKRVLIPRFLVSATVTMVAWVINGVPVRSLPLSHTTLFDIMVYQIFHLVVKSIKVWYRPNYSLPAEPPMLEEATEPILSSAPSTKASNGPEGDSLTVKRKGK